MSSWRAEYNYLGNQTEKGGEIVITKKKKTSTGSTTAWEDSTQHLGHQAEEVHADGALGFSTKKRTKPGVDVKGLGLGGRGCRAAKIPLPKGAITSNKFLTIGTVIYCLSAQKCLSTSEKMRTNKKYISLVPFELLMRRS